MENNTVVENMKWVIQKLMDERPEAAGGFECQLTLANGATAAGTLVKTEREGLYRMVTIVRKGDQRSGELLSVDMYLPVELVVLVTVPTSERDKPRIVTPNGAGRILG